ncbi:MAG: Thiol-disulfide isomerase or thioredoxin [Mucilaginibacter sp.]|nr:Thiol-disulfide isomerase or thioredoxin [Mucilaginibacter sp.]
MKKSYRYIYLLILLTTIRPYCSFSQTRELKRGQQVPDLEFADAYNYKTNKPAPVKIADLKGKLIILDFWGTFCEPCLEGFPKLDSMQKHFGDKIQVCTVNLQSKAVIDKFFKVHTAVFKPSVPFITGDTVLFKMFPHTGVPFQVWISPAGKVLYLTDGYNLTTSNINSALAGKESGIREAAKNVYPETLFDEKWKDLVEYSSYLCRFKDGLHLEGPVKGKGFSAIGTIAELYLQAYDGLTDHRYKLLEPGRLVLEVKDSDKYVTKVHGDAYVDWQEKNLFGYQLSVPRDARVNIYKLMIQDLNRYFNVKAGIQQRMVKCLVLIRTSQKDKLKTMGGIEKDSFYHLQKRAVPLGPMRYLMNKPFTVFVDRIKNMSEYGFHQLFRDSTGYTGNIDIKMDGGILDDLNLITFKKELNKYDLDLVERECLLDVLVIKDNGQIE